MNTSQFLFFLFVLLPLSTSVFAQGHSGRYGNEWIDYSLGKQYYKIKVHEDGMYRVSAAVLQQAGANISSINPNNIQLFWEGKEIPIQVEDSSGLLTYVQFYGEKNRGAYDADLYNDLTHHLNEKYSLFHDTAAYFLTWGFLPSTKHFTNKVANLSNLPAKEPYFMHTNSVVFSSMWNPGRVWQVATMQLSKSTFEYGEGYSSGLASSRLTTIPTEHPYVGGPDPFVDVKFFTPGLLAHTLDIGVGPSIYSTNNFNGLKVDKFTSTFPSSKLVSTGTDISVNGSATNAFDEYYIPYIDLTYARMFDFDAQFIFPFKMLSNINRKYIEIDNIDNTNASANQFFLYDLTNLERIHCVYDAINVRAQTDLSPSSADRELIFINEGNSNSYQNITTVKSVTFRNFLAPSYQTTDYVIITHPSLRINSSGANPILDYSNYRQSSAGGGYITTDIDIQELYDQFAYGIDYHPLAIRHFGHYIKKFWTNPEYAFLIGKGREYKDVHSQPSNMLLPSFGVPASDQILMASINKDEPSLAVGRLAANTGDQVSLYLQKIQDVEAQRAAAQSLPNKGWTKNILHLGGGNNPNEQVVLQQFLNGMGAIVSAPFYNSTVSSFFNSISPVLITQDPALDTLIDNGVSMITFMGGDNFNFKLGLPQNYTNYQKYPLFNVMACSDVNDSGIHGIFPSMSEDFIFEPQAGAGAFLACSDAISISSANSYFREFYKAISVDEYGEGVAKAIKQAIRTLENGPLYPTTTQMACHFMDFHGDPAYKVADTSILSAAQFIAEEKLEKGANVFPVPASNNLNVEFSSQEQTSVKVSLVDMLGRAVVQKLYSISEGLNKIQLDVNVVLPGSYLLTIERPTQSDLIQKIIISRD